MPWAPPYPSCHRIQGSLALASRPQSRAWEHTGHRKGPGYRRAAGSGRKQDRPLGFPTCGPSRGLLKEVVSIREGLVGAKAREVGGWVFSGSSSPTPSAFQEGSRKLCWQGPSSSPLPGREGRGGGGGQAVQAFLALPQHPPMWIQLPGTRPGHSGTTPLTPEEVQWG